MVTKDNWPLRRTTSDSEEVVRGTKTLGPLRAAGGTCIEVSCFRFVDGMKRRKMIEEGSGGLKERDR